MIRKVPPPPTTKKIGKAPAKPPKFVPPAQIVFTAQQQENQENQEDTNQVSPATNEQKNHVREQPVFQVTQEQPFMQEVKPAAQEPKMSQETIQTNQQKEDLTAQIQEEKIEQGIIEFNVQKRKAPEPKKGIPKLPVGNKKTPPMAKNFPKKIPTPQIQSDTQNQDQTSNQKPKIETQKVPEIPEKSIENQGQVETSLKPQAKPKSTQTIKTEEDIIQVEKVKATQKFEEVRKQEVLEVPLIEQPRKVAPPPSAKKTGGQRIPPPTKKIPNPPKPVFIPPEAQNQTPFETKIDEKQEEVPVKVPSSKQIVQNPMQEMPQKQKEHNITEIPLPKKNMVPPAPKKVPAPAPKKIQTKAPAKIQPAKQEIQEQVPEVQQQEKKQIIKPIKSQPSKKQPEPPKRQQEKTETETSQPSAGPKAYNQLEQKLRRLEMMRSRIDQSSQESYSNHNDDIQEDFHEELQESENEEHQQKRELINIRDDHDLNEREQETFKHDDEFIIGETNYDEMEIKDDHEPEIHSSHDEQNSLQPFGGQTQVQSNVSQEQTQHQYLPDEVPSSPLESQGSIPKHHEHYHHSASNNVAHADKYHSQANFSSIQTSGQTKQEKQNEEQKSEIVAGPNPLSQIPPPKAKDSSIISNKSESVKQKKEVAKEKQQQILKQHQLARKPHSTTTQIEQLLAKFNSKKQQYLSNLQKLKSTQEKFKKQEQSYHERITKLLEEVNHKNIMLLKHANLPFDRIPNPDRLKVVEEL